MLTRSQAMLRLLAMGAMLAVALLVFSTIAPDSALSDHNPGGCDVIEGGPGNNNLVGTGACEDLFGKKGNDRVNGNGGRDDVHGGPASDDLWGGSENDELYGASGWDEMHGGGDQDLVRDTFEGDRDWGCGGAGIDVVNVKDGDHVDDLWTYEQGSQWDGGDARRSGNCPPLSPGQNGV